MQLVITKGWEVSEAEHAYSRALDLCRQGGDALQLFVALAGLFRLHIMRGNHLKAHELAQQLMALADRQDDATLRMSAHSIVGVSLFFLGEFAQSRQHLEHSLGLYDLQQHRFLSALYGDDPGVASLSVLSCILALLGYPDQALQKCHEALSLAQELSHPPALTLATALTAQCHQFRGEKQATQERAEAIIALCHEREILVGVEWGMMLRGWARAEQGYEEEGIAQLREGVAGYQAKQVRAFLPYYLALLAEVYGKVGRSQAGLALLAEALERADTDGQRCYEAGLYQLKGELLLAQEGKSQRSKVKGQKSNSMHHAEEAEACFQQAIEIARRQEAKSLELRAVMSLSRLWQEQGKKKHAREMLAKIYSWFTEGFGTKDMQEAKALLEELA